MVTCLNWQALKCSSSRTELLILWRDGCPCCAGIQAGCTAPPLVRHWRRIAVTVLALAPALGLLQAFGAVAMGALNSRVGPVYHARLRATVTQTLDERIVIVDIDEASLAEWGHWPWIRHKLAQL